MRLRGLRSRLSVCAAPKLVVERSASVYVSAAAAKANTTPSGPTGLEHRPVVGLQTPAVWHGSDGVHTIALAPTQAPAWQVSLWVQRSPSSQALPSALRGSLHVPVAGS